MSLFTKIKKFKDTAEKVKDFTGRLGDGSISDNTRTEIINDTARLGPRIPQIDTIKANFNTGLASPARYAVLISTPQSLKTDASFLTFRTQNVSLPGKSLLTSEAKPKGFGQVVRYPYQNLFGQLEMTFICDEDFKEYKIFDEIKNEDDEYLRVKSEIKKLINKKIIVSVKKNYFSKLLVVLKLYLSNFKKNQIKLIL